MLATAGLISVAAMMAAAPMAHAATDSIKVTNAKHTAGPNDSSVVEVTGTATCAPSDEKAVVNVEAQVKTDRQEMVNNDPDPFGTADNTELEEVRITCDGKSHKWTATTHAVENPPINEITEIYAKLDHSGTTLASVDWKPRK
ncbi:hypothetical protein AWN90_20570 [Nocardia terpenica]|uniref:DUF4333 domain-containing protein n=1 Tax=Nocardia terpenica TaxID=455432 RepID=A0A161Z6S4_9NOCA|nr:hypothetical protein AWN90_20570 [Nocardia terpenica]